MNPNACLPAEFSSPVLPMIVHAECLESVSSCCFASCEYRSNPQPNCFQISAFSTCDQFTTCGNQIYWVSTKSLPHATIGGLEKLRAYLAHNVLEPDILDAETGC